MQAFWGMPVASGSRPRIPERGEMRHQTQGRLLPVLTITCWTRGLCVGFATRRRATRHAVTATRYAVTATRHAVTVARPSGKWSPMTMSTTKSGFRLQHGPHHRPGDMCLRIMARFHIRRHQHGYLSNGHAGKIICRCTYSLCIPICDASMRYPSMRYPSMRYPSMAIQVSKYY
eukprot:361280-Chlamydomonas_euryale.AAC.1